MSADEDQVRLCERDYNIVWRIGTASQRKVDHRFEIYDWQSKTRGEVHIEERPKGSEGKWTAVRNHWQFMLSLDGVEDLYPYLDFTAEEEGEEPEEGLDTYDDDHQELFYGGILGGNNDYRPTFKLKIMHPERGNFRLSSDVGL